MTDPKPVRITGLIVSFALAAAFFVWTRAYFEPLHTGVDQNGYLVGGKQFSRTLLPRQTPTKIGRPGEFDPHAFVADMWVTAANDKHSFDPKYPIGLPLLYAILIWATAGGTTAAFSLSPVAMAATLPAVFVVVRRFSNTFGGLLATLAFAVSPVTTALTNNPNSHAVTVCAATWGMAAVLRWWDDGGRAWAIVGGLLVGYAATVRYTEGLLALPLLWAAILRPSCRMSHGVGRKSEKPPAISDKTLTANYKRRLDGLSMIGAWLIPVGCLAAYNLYFLGTLTGYDATNESTGFSWAYFFDNWATAVRQLGVNGVLLLLPAAIVGLLWMPWRDWRHAGFVLLWLLPIADLYLFYYWGPDGIGYLRFFMTTLPAFLTAAFWVLARVGDRAGDRPRAPLRWWRVALALVLGLTVSAAIFYSVRYDEKARSLATVQNYLDRPPTAFQRLGGGASLFGGVVAAGLIAGAAAAATRRTVGPLAVGVVTLISTAVSADESAFALEGGAYVTRSTQVSIDAVRQLVPDGAMLVSRELNFLHPLQFLTDDRLYTGLSFDRNWVNGRPRAASDDPVLVDPVRGQQLFDALQAFDQKALTEQARVTLHAALLAKRRVFVVEAAPLDQMLAAIRKKAEGPVPEFVRRFVVKPKDQSLVGRRVAWWTVPMVVKDDRRNVPRGRKPERTFPPTACYQLWEVTAG